MASVGTPIDSNPTHAPEFNLSPVRKWGMLVVLSLALAIIILDTTILNVALSAIIRDLKTDIQSIQWVITSYSLTLAALTITGGRMGDIFGKKRMFVLGAVLFAVGSFLASISTNVGTLIAGEAIVEGIGAALMMPATASLLVTNFFGKERALAFGVWGGIAGASAALGPIVGGFLATNYSWRWGFRINLFVVALLILGSFIIPKSKILEKRPSIDVMGVVLSALGMLSLVFGIIESSTYGWLKAKETFSAFGYTFTMPYDISVVPVFILIGVIIMAIFFATQIMREKAGKTPLVSISLFKNRTFTAGIFTTGIMALGQTGLIFSIPVFLQAVRGADAFNTGLSLLPMSLALLIVSPISAVLGRKFEARTLIALGLILNAIAYIVLYFMMNVDATSVTLIPGLALYGIGMGLVMSQINNITLSAVEPRQAGEASGVNNTLRQVGSTLGSAIMGAILIGAMSTQLAAGIKNSDKVPENMKESLATAIASQTSNVEFGGGAQIEGKLPDALKTEIISIGHEATVSSVKETLLYGSLFAFLGFLASFFLPTRNVRREEKNKQVAAASAPAHIQTPAASQMKPHSFDAYLDAETISKLLAFDLAQKEAGKPGVKEEIEAVMEAAAMDVSLLDFTDPRFSQGRTLFNHGFGRVLGMETLGEYLASLPSVPAELQAHDPEFPLLVLVDARVSPLVAAGLLQVTPKGTPNALQAAAIDSTPKTAYFIRMQDGARYAGLSMNSALAAFTPTEKALTVEEGLALYAQDKEGLKKRFIDLIGTPHEGFDNSAACLGIWENDPQIRYRWQDHADPRCGAGSKKVA
jgi:MFS family permease